MTPIQQSFEREKNVEIKFQKIRKNAVFQEVTALLSFLTAFILIFMSKIHCQNKVN